MIDLHSHSNLSDGALTPAALVARARANGLSHLAITDHDCVDAIQELTPESQGPLHIIPGVEISTLWQQREVHIVGLFVDPASIALQALLQRQQQLRRQRVEEFDQRLQKLGVIGLQDYIATLPCRAVSRNHVADFLVSRSLVADKQQAFNKYLGSSGRVRTAAQWCSIDEAVGTIRSAGGIAVLAHPDRYKLSRSKLQSLLAEFREAGGEAMEVSYSNLSHEKLLSLAASCTSLDLWASQGSDFHTPDAEWMDLGRIRQLPHNCRERALWWHPRWPADMVPAASPGC